MFFPFKVGIFFLKLCDDVLLVACRNVKKNPFAPSPRKLTSSKRNQHPAYY